MNDLKNLLDIAIFAAKQAGDFLNKSKSEKKEILEKCVKMHGSLSKIG